MIAAEPAGVDIGMFGEGWAKGADVFQCLHAGELLTNLDPPITMCDGLRGHMKVLWIFEK